MFDSEIHNIMASMLEVPERNSTVVEIFGWTAYLWLGVASVIFIPVALFAVFISSFEGGHDFFELRLFFPFAVVAFLSAIPLGAIAGQVGLGLGLVLMVLVAAVQYPIYALFILHSRNVVRSVLILLFVHFAMFGSGYLIKDAVKPAPRSAQAFSTSSPTSESYEITRR